LFCEAFQATRDLLHLLRRKSRVELLARRFAFLFNRQSHRLQRVSGIPAIAMKLLDEADQHVDVADCAKPLGDHPEPSVELARRVRVEAQDREQFAKTTRRHASAVKRLDITLVKPFRFVRKDADEFMEHGVQFSWGDHRWNCGF
jgi:hypothetical protein